MPTENKLKEWDKLRIYVKKNFYNLTSLERASRAMDLIDLWMQEELFQSQWKPIAAHVKTDNYQLLLDSFYQFIPFGTGGRRGKVGFGPNRINEATVALSVQGHCDYLLNYFLNKNGGKDPVLSVVVAYDVRIFKDISLIYNFIKDNPLLDLTSEKLAKIACEIYAGSGIQCYINIPEQDGQSYLSTPELSFLIRRLGAHGGINVSASHNHPDDNGFKFFNTEGAQDIPPYDEKLASFMNHIQKVNRMDFEEGLKKGLIKKIPATLHTEYINTNLDIKRIKQIDLIDSAPPIVFTPLCGTGVTTVAEVLRAAGYKVIEDPAQSRFDGTFESIPLRLPNPEIPEAAMPATQTAEKYSSPIVLSTDPDADRLGILTKNKDGSWIHLNGNEIGTILAYYMILDKERGPSRKGIVITTLVTTSMIERIANMGHCQSVTDLFVGFKFIANVLYSLEKKGFYKDIKAKADDLVFALEESHGFLLTPKIRDKDAAGASLILCDLLARLNKEGRNFSDYLDEIAFKCGNFGNDARGILMGGIEGTDALNRLMDSLRSNYPKSLNGLKVLEIKDYLYDISTGRPRVDPDSSEGKASNIIQFRFENARIIIRPSGTEPKMKIYAEIEAPNNISRQEAKKKARDLATMMFRECLTILGEEYRLSSIAELIPDHVDLKLKKAFDDKFTPEFLSMANQIAMMDKDDLLAWLRTRLERYGGGSDPLQSMRAVLIELCLHPWISLDKITMNSLSLIADKLKLID